MKTHIIHTCEICGYKDTDMEKVKQCEDQGIPKILVKKGDKIKFKDCNETPIAKAIINDSYRYYTVLNYEDRNAWERCYLYGQILTEYEVIDVIQNGHSIKYCLGKDSCPLLAWGDWRNWNYYPEIKNNELMQKILDLYN